MNKFFLAITMVSALSIATFDAAEAQQRQGYKRYNHSQNYYRGGNRYVQNNYYGGRRGGWNNNAAWAAGIGGLAVGAIIGGALASQPAYAYPAPGPVCQQVQISQRLVPNGYGGYYYAPIYATQCY